MDTMKIVQLNHTNPHHTHIILSLLVQSTLDYGDMDRDPRLSAWQRGQGRWAVVVNAQGCVMGIVSVVSLSDSEGDALLWLEVLPHYRKRGMGRALLSWARGQTRQNLVIKSVPTAAGFYLHCGA